jgi:hypothetical protein
MARHGVVILIFPRGQIRETLKHVVVISESASSFSFSLTKKRRITEKSCKFVQNNIARREMNLIKYRVTLTIEIIFVRLATHLRFYVGTLHCQIQI